MALPDTLSTTTVTGSFMDPAGSPQRGLVSFAPSVPLADPGDSVIIAPAVRTYQLSSGTFTSDPLVSTDNLAVEPGGWFYTVTVTVQNAQPYSFACSIPSSPSPVDISALVPLEPVPVMAGYLPLSGGHLTGPLYAAESPAQDSEVATKGYVDVTASSLAAKAPVQEATAAALPANTATALTLTANFTGPLAVDGTAVSSGDRILVKNEATPANNGIYVATASGSSVTPYVLTRAADMDTPAQVPGAYAYVEQGTVNRASGWIVASPGPFTLGSTAITWTQFTGLGEVTAGAGLTASGNTVSLASPVSVAHGGTGSTTQNFVDLLTDQSAAGAKTFTGEVIVPAPVNATDAATKAYVDATAQGLSVKPAVNEATAAALPAYTYSNGSSGVGATLTGDSTGVLTVDGQAVALNDRVLVQNETSTNAPANGIYLCTTAGAGGGSAAAYVLTRAADMDVAAQFPGAFTFVEKGTVNAGAGFVCITPATVTVGTTAISFSQFSAAGAYAAGTGLSLSGTTFSLTSPVTVAHGGTGSATQNFTGLLTKTAVKAHSDSPVPASAGDYVACDTTAGTITVTLPNAPAVNTVVGVKLIASASPVNAVTVACAGSDVINKTSGATTYTLSLLNQGATFQYGSGGIWLIQNDDLPLGSLDGRYAEKSSATNAVLYLSSASGASDSNDGLSWGSPKATLAGAISALGGSAGAIIAGAGTFNFTTVNWPLGTSVIGQGLDVTILHSTATTGSALANPSPGTRILYGGHLEGFNLTGAGAGNPTIGLDLESRTHATVRDVLVTGFGTGISIASASAGFCLYNRFWNTIASTCTTGWQVGGEGSNSNTFTGCQGSACTTGAAIADSNQNQFFGCQFESNTTGVAITSTGGTGGHSVSNVLSGCRFENNGTGWTTDALSTGNYITGAYYSGNTTSYTDTSAATVQLTDPSGGIIVPAGGYVYAGGIPTVNTGFPLQKGQVSIVSTGASTAVGFTAYEQDGTDNRRIAFWLGGATSWGIGFAFASGTPPPFKLYNGSTSLNPITCNGAQTVFGGGVAQLVATQTLISNGAVTINANNGNVQTITLQANATSSSITNPVTGQELTIRWQQDATGSRTYLWPVACKFAGGAAPSASTAAGYTDSVTFIYNGSAWQEKCRSAAIH